MATNRDKFNAMGNEELADRLARSDNPCEYCAYAESGDKNCYLNTCANGIIKWLESEVKDD